MLTAVAEPQLQLDSATAQMAALGLDKERLLVPTLLHLRADGGDAQADRRLRPFARRAASTRRPPGVAIRARKPWRRLRTSWLGW